MTRIPLLSGRAPHERTQSQINHNEITISRSRRREDPDKTVSNLVQLSVEKHVRSTERFNREKREVKLSMKS